MRMTDWMGGLVDRMSAKWPRRRSKISRQVEFLESRVVLSGTDPTGAAAQRFIVQLTPAASAQATSTALAQQYFATSEIAFQVSESLGLPGQFVVTTDELSSTRARAALRSNQSVKFFDVDTNVAGQLVPNDASFGDQTGLRNLGTNGTTNDADIDADEAWNITTGSSSVVVAVIDSGIDYTHPDLYLNIWLNPGELPAALRSSLVDADTDGRITFRDLNAPANASFVTDINSTSYIDAGDLLQDSRWENGLDEDGNGRVDDLIGWDFRNNDNDPFDTHGHGTHVAGVIGAVGNNTFGVAGLNWNTSIMPLRFLDAVAGQGLTGSTSDAIEAINYTTALKTRSQDNVNIRVSNNSWGSLDSFSQTLRDSIAANGVAGVLFVAAAGNGEGRTGTGVDLDTSGLGFFPATFDLDHIVAVAATNANDTLATFSQFGAKSIDLAAPGVAILSTEPGGGYAFRSGTSMATPHASGVAALVLAQTPDASVQELRQALLQSVDTKSSLTGKVATGGRLNARAALQVDTFAPKASVVSSPNVTIGGAGSYEFQVLYRDNADIDFNSIDNTDVRVVPLNAQDSPLSVTISNLVLDSEPGTPGNQPVVTYRIVPPGGTWNLDDNGDYHIELLANAVADTRAGTPNRTPAQTLGTFEVSIAYEGQILVTTFADGADSNPADSTSQTSGGQSTLRSAIQTANTVAGLNTIVLERGTYTLNVAGANEHAAATGDLDITSEIVILGNGATIEIVGGIDRVLDVLASGSLILRDVTIRGGSTSSLGGGLRNAGATSIFGSTFTANTASEGGAIASGAGTISLTNVTVSTNSAANGAGIDVSGGALSLLNTTITANVASADTGGLRRTGTPTVGVTNTILAGNSAQTNPDISGTFNLAGLRNNLVGDPGNSGLTDGTSGNVVSAMGAKLGPLQLNSGLTMTHELQAGSLAIDAGTNGMAPALDQRGVARPVDGNNDRTAVADIGAVERYFGEISGTVFNDANANGVQDGDERGIGGFEVILDLNSNGVGDLGEPVVTTPSDNVATAGIDEGGVYTFTGLAPGKYQVIQRAPTGWQQLGPVTNVNESVIDLANLRSGGGGNGSKGFVINGNEASLRFGVVMGSAGDFNGDGYDDIVVSGFNTFLPDYLVYGTPSGLPAEFSVADLANGTYAATRFTRPGKQSRLIQTVGDLNNDGKDDLLFAIGDTFSAGDVSGRAYVMYGRNDLVGAQFDITTVVSASAGFILQGLVTPDSLGVGDFNHDTFSDIALGYGYADAGGRPDAGQALILHGEAGGFTGTIDLLSPGLHTVTRIDGRFSGDRLGLTLAANGDINGDHIDDLVAAAPNAFRLNRDGNSEIYLLFGSATLGTTIDLNTLDVTTHVRMTPQANGMLGIGVAVVDLNVDGNSEVLLGQMINGTQGPYLLPGRATGFMSSTVQIDLSTAGVQSSGSIFFKIDQVGSPGRTITSAGDVNGDGFDDVLIGNPRGNLEGVLRPGLGYLVFGGPLSSLPLNLGRLGTSEVDVTRGLLIKGIGAEDAATDRISSAGDFNGDGFADLVIGSLYADPNGFASGQVYVVYGRPNPTLSPRSGFYVVDLPAAGNVSSANFANRPQPATLRGTVYRDLNSNAARDAGEAGISGFQIYLDTNNDGSFTSGEPTTTTNSNGDYVFTNITPLTTYRVREVVPLGFTQTFPTQANGSQHIVTPTPGEEITLLDFGSIDLVGGVGLGTGGLSGRIFNDTNGNGRLDSGETGLAGVTVFVDLNDNGVRDTSPVMEPQFVTTADNGGTPEDEAGAYSFTGLPARDYPVRIVTPGSMALTSPRVGQFISSSSAGGQGPVAAASINYNGDAFPDMVIVTAFRADVLVRVNNGDGTFGAPFSVVGTSALARLADPRSLAVGDLNGDGRPDLVIGNNSLNRPAVLLNDGAGSFVPASLPALGLADTSSVAIGKFNQEDNFPDIAVASEFGNRVYVLINNGSGGFTLRDTLTPGNAPVNVLGVDLDKDGDSDLVVANRDDNTLRTFLLQGNNTFLTSVPSLYTKTTGNGPYRIAKGDLNGDTYDDVVVANVFDQRVSVFLSLQTGALADAINLQVGGRPSSVAVADVNNDGLLDLAVTTLSQQGFTTLLNLGGGRFQAPTAAGVASFADSLSPTILSFDIEADGDGDLLVLQPERDGGRLIIQQNAPIASNYRASVLADQTMTDLNFGLINGSFSTGQLSISANNAQRAEGNSGTTTFTFTVTRTGNLSGSASADFAVNGSTANAATEADFGGSFPTGSVSFAPNEATRTITVLVTGDTVQELDETFVVTLSNPSSGSSLATATASSVITNDDASLAISTSNAQRAEGNSGTTGFTFVVSRAGAIDGTTTVNFAVTGTGTFAATPADFGGQFPTGMVSFGPNETTKIVTINVTGNSDLEPDETFLATLSNPSGNASISTPTAIGTIQNDDASLAVAATSATLPEGHAGQTTFTFTVTRTGLLTSTVSAAFGLSGNGANPADVDDFGGMFPSGTVSFAANETSKVISINVSGDTQLEGDEGFIVTLSNPVSGASLGTSTATGTILNDDASVSVAATNASRAEGQSSTTAFTFTVTRAGNSTGTASVNYAITAQGSNPADITDFGGAFPNGTVNFAANETSKVVTINVDGDATIENDETFLLTLSNPSLGLTIGTATATGTIISDDSQLAIAATNATRIERNSGTTQFTFTVTRTGTTTGTASANFAVTGQGTSPADVTDFGGSFPNGSVSFAIGETSKTITINVVGDVSVEPDEGFQVTLSGASGAALQTASATGTILNDEFPVTVRVNEAGQLSISDAGGTANDITVTRNAKNEYVVTSPVSELSTDGVTPTNTVVIPVSSVTAGLLAELGTGNDRLNLTGLALSATVLGGDGNDTVFGGSLADSLNGEAGDDSLNGGSSDDQITGGLGNDILDGGAGTGDVLVETSSGTLTMTNTQFITVVSAVTATDTLSNFERANIVGSTSANRIDLSGFAASTGTTINGAGANDTIIGSPGPDMIFALTGADSISGLGGADMISSGSGNDTISGGDGADNLNGQVGNDSLLGDDGNDILVGGAGLDTLQGGLGNDFLSGQAEAGLLSGGDGNDTLQGNTANDTLNGDVGDDRLFGLQGDDVVNGGEGADSLLGGIGTDSLSGGAGADTLQGDLGNDTLDGGADFDRINEVLDTNLTIVGITLSTTTMGTDSVIAVERIQVSGGASDNFFDGRLATVPVFLSGGDGNDTLLGGSKADGVVGGEGNDVLSGGAGVDVIDGGNGTDFWMEKADVDFTVNGTTVTSSATGTETPTSVERIVLIGGVGANKLDASLATVSVVLIGGRGNDTLLGGSGADTLSGGNRNDATVPGGDGGDSLDGGVGADTLESDPADTINFGAGDTTVADVFALLPSWIDAL